MPDGDFVLTWLHIGDLHVTLATEPNHRALRRIVAPMQGLPAGSVDFAVLPGDNADDGTPAQFRLVRDAVAALPMDLHILPCDHDRKPGALDAFHDVLGAPPLPEALVASGHRRLFLDVVSAGGGGPDFRIGEDQPDRLDRELQAASAAAQHAVVFMHTYPADLRRGAARLAALPARPHVACVDMGHTHDNELANDGGVSWRFKPSAPAWPFVLITSPTDRRLATRAGPLPGAAAPVHANVRTKVLGDAGIMSVEMQVDDGAWPPMRQAPGAPSLREAPAPATGRPITLRARNAQGRSDADRVEPAGPGWVAPRRHADGSDADRVGVSPARGIVGTQLGPNRNGRQR